MSSSSSSSDEDFLPVGISMLNINSKNQYVPVMAQRNEVVEFDLPPQLQYMFLLDRAMEALNKTRDDDGDRIKLPLKVLRKSRKTWVNVVEVTAKLNRQPEHLAHFITESLFTEGSINKDGYLILTGSHLQSDIEKPLRNFIELYVVCRSCDSVDDTYITKDNKLFFLKCDRCKASRCVGNAIEGFTLKDKSKPKLRGLV